MDYESLPGGDKNYKINIMVSDGGSGGTSLRPSSSVIIAVGNTNDNPPLIRNFTSIVDKAAPARTNVIQMQVYDPDGSGINYFFWTGSGASRLCFQFLYFLLAEILSSSQK